MKSYLIFPFLLYLTKQVRCGYLTGHHSLPPNLITSRALLGGAVGGGISTGAYSSSHLSQTVSTSPNQFQSSYYTYHPFDYDYNRGNQGSRLNQGPTSTNQGQSQGQNFGQNLNGYHANIPTVIAYGSYGYNNQGQGQSQGSLHNQGSQYQSQSETYQNQGQYQNQNQQYRYNSGNGQNGRF